MTRVLVTGANGHLGANTIRALLQLGHKPVPFVRTTSDLRGLAGLGLSYAYGDIRDGASLTRAAAGCQVIIHSAAVFRYWGKNPAEILETSLTGVHNVFQAAAAVSAERIIFTSSTYALGFSDDFDQPLNTTDWNENPVTPYAMAKTRSERAAWRLADETGIPLVVMCPSGIWGPYDYRLTPPMRWIRDLVTGLTAVIDTGASFIDARDAGLFHALAVEVGVPGKRYALAGDNLTMAEMAAIVNQLTGTRHIKLNLPKPAMVGIASLMENLAKFTGQPPLSTRAFIEESYRRYQVIDGRLANQIFGLTPRKGQEMITDAVRWLVHVGAFTPRRVSRLANRFPPDPEW